MGLVLPLPARAECRFQFRAQEFHCVQLVALSSQAHPKQMEMIWHQAISGAIECVTCRRVKHQFTESRMKRGCQPATRVLFQRIGPENDGMTLVVVPLQSRQLAFAVEWHSPHCIRRRKEAEAKPYTPTPVAAEVTRRIEGKRFVARILVRLLTSAATDFGFGQLLAKT